MLVPNTPGCWIRYPSGCPNQKHREQYEHLQNPKNWNRDNFNGASESLDKCIARKNAINDWCGVFDVVMIYVSGIKIYNERNTSDNEDN